VSDEPLFLAIDIGGTKLAAGLVDAAGKVRLSHRHPTPRGAAEDVFASLRSLVQQVLRDAEVTPVACGVGCGGPMTRGGEQVSPVNIPGWRAFPLKQRLWHLTGLEVRVDNDVKALALAEGRYGAATGAQDYLSMVVSTGVGGGIVSGGRLLDGATGNAGHIGHVIVEPQGHPCGCGARGCLEAEVSGTAIAAITGHPAAEADASTVERTGRLVGRAVASAAALLDLRLAVVGGSVALGFGAPLFRAAQEELEACARLDFTSGIRILPSSLGPDGGIIGAALLAAEGAA
jgi:glucokinase